MFEETAERIVSRLTEVSIDSGDARATITIVDYSGCAGDTVTVTIGGIAHVLTEGVDWNRGSSNILAALSLAAAINALAGVSASAIGAVVTITAPKNITSLAVSDAVNMTLVDSSLTTIFDPSKNWEVDKWKDAIIEVEVDDIHYYRTISSNIADTLTIATLPAGHPVAAGAHYNIRLSTRIVTISGQAVTISSGNIAVVSGNVAVVSGEVHVISGQLIAKVSGEVMQIILPTEFKTGLIRSITSASGGEVLHSGAVKAAQIKSDKDNSGAIVIGGATNRPWYQARCSGLGFVLDPGEAKSEDIDNFNRIYVVAQVSGDQISFGGVN